MAAYLNAQSAVEGSRSSLVKHIKDCARSVKAMNDGTKSLSYGKWRWKLIKKGDCDER